MSRSYSNSKPDSSSKQFHDSKSRICPDNVSTQDLVLHSQSSDQILHLQRTLGNQTTMGLLRSNENKKITPQISKTANKENVQRRVWSASEFNKEIDSSGSERLTAISKLLVELDKYANDPQKRGPILSVLRILFECGSATRLANKSLRTLRIWGSNSENRLARGRRRRI